MKRVFLVIITGGIILAKGDWQIYDCSVLPREADTAWHEVSGTNPDDVPEIVSVIDDQEIQGNKLIKVESGANVGGGAFKEVWSYPWRANADKGITIAFRIKNLDPNSFDRGICMYIANGAYRERIITKADGRFKFDKGGVYVEGFEGANEWHIYRITLIGNVFTLYIDEENLAWAESNGESHEGNYYQFGDAGGDTYGALYDWIVWDTTGAYSPSEKALPSGLTGVTGVVKEEKGKFATKYSLEQNYPNPFNPVTTIPFEILKPGFVKLTIYDMFGHEVTILVNERLKQGVYKVEFNGQNLPSGIYFYKLQTDQFTGVKKMILVK